ALNLPLGRWTPVAGAPAFSVSRCCACAAGESLGAGGVPGPRPLRGAASVEAVWGAPATAGATARHEGGGPKRRTGRPERAGVRRHGWRLARPPAGASPLMT